MTDAFVIMPNHVHGLVQLTETAEHTSTLGRIIGSFKSAVSARVNTLRATPGAPVWQRGYYERVLRNEDELLRARRYIVENPLKWHLDQENPLRINAGGPLA
ncbi:MAG: transposase [Gemmatimonadetes bacterium]|nr:transposase [Gemmatimonadota bacterium]